MGASGYGTNGRNGSRPAVAGLPGSLPPPAGPRVALVSGGSRGLGLRVVRALALRRMRVVLACRSVERGHAALELLGGLAAQVAVRPLDVTDAGSVARLAAWLEQRLGRCDVLVNNAAVLLDDERTAATADTSVVRATLETNLVGAWRLTQAVVPLMRRRGYGRIVNVSSGLAALAATGPHLPAYRISKTAINALTRMLADELAGDGILVNACCPAPVGPGGAAPGPSASPETPVWLATLPDGGPTGGFFRERAPIAW